MNLCTKRERVWHMSNILYSHNKEAYEAAVTMLEQVGKAAIIHPTGTGKSFIGFYLCSEEANKRVCWLSPSENIYLTQRENWLTAGGEDLSNICFFTYAKLMIMDDSDIESIKPDYIVLDEFHRCGAEMWGQGVDRLLAMYPSVPLLGLTATNIRYLDNQRDMAEELFDGNVASEITLGEAIVRGILTPPKYVLSVFSYQKDLEKYEARVRGTQNPAARRAAEEYLEALRRALEKADGLDKIFYKHMSKRHGKYIVFCSDFEHMQMMKEEVIKWVAKVDDAPRVYSAYSNDPKSYQAFADFKKDSSEHLRLLFSIDMLNEGIHVSDIDGVILLRPTVSPIIYKQQIGRAFSAGSTNNAVIFDVVMNIDNLYTISGIEREMDAAIEYFLQNGERDSIVKDRFEIFDEIKDCRELFNKLNDCLSAGWDKMYQYAKAYFEEHGNLIISRSYKTAEGYALGRWIQTQRRVKAGQHYGVLTPDQIAKLDAIGMEWGSVYNYYWERKFGAAKKYFEKHGNLEVKARYVTGDGIELGRWIQCLRTCEHRGVRPKYLTPERKAALEEIGMVWDDRSSWNTHYPVAKKYYEEHGDLNVPVNYKTEKGITLGAWLSRTRSMYNAGMISCFLTEEQIAKLESIGMVWETKFDQVWSRCYGEARTYFEENQDLYVPVSYITPSGIRLGRWIARQRSEYQAGELSEEKIEKLNELNMLWKKPDSWRVRYDAVKEYLEKNGGATVCQDVVVDGMWIGKWLAIQRKRLEKGDKKLTEEQRKLLNELPHA